MKIQVLYFKGCPNHEPTVARVRQVIERLGVGAAFSEVELTPDDDAAALRFLGSPTVLVNDQDIDPACRANVSYGFSCRTYAGDGMPTESLIEQAILEARDGDGAGLSCCAHAGERDQPAGGSSGATTDRAAWRSGLGAVGTAALASACCWLPLLLMSFGVTAGGVAGFFVKTRPFFLAAAVIFLGTGFYFAYFRGFRKPTCQPGDACAAPNPRLQRFNRATLWFAAVLVIGFTLFPYYSPPMIRAWGANASTFGDGTSPPATTGALATYRFRIDGMDCRACAAGIEVRVGQLPGIASASVSYDQSQAVVHADPDQFDPAAFAHAVASAGFNAQLTSEQPDPAATPLSERQTP